MIFIAAAHMVLDQRSSFIANGRGALVFPAASDPGIETEARGPI
jgi:hypothetical protein